MQTQSAQVLVHPSLLHGDRIPELTQLSLKTGRTVVLSGHKAKLVRAQKTK